MAMIVPFGRSPEARAKAQLPMPDPQWSMMAAAMMHENGRLVQSDQKLDQQADANAKSTEPKAKP